MSNMDTQMQDLLTKIARETDPGKKQGLLEQLAELSTQAQTHLTAPSGSRTRAELLLALNQAHEAVERTSLQMVTLGITRADQLDVLDAAATDLKAIFGGFEIPAVTDPFARYATGGGMFAVSSETEDLVAVLSKTESERDYANNELEIVRERLNTVTEDLANAKKDLRQALQRIPSDPAPILGEDGDEEGDFFGPLEKENEGFPRIQPEPADAPQEGGMLDDFDLDLDVPEDEEELGWKGMAIAEIMKEWPTRADFVGANKPRWVPEVVWQIGSASKILDEYDVESPEDEE